MLVVKLLKNGVQQIECLGGGYIYLVNDNVFGDILRFGGEKHWYPACVFGELGYILRLTEDYNKTTVKSILAKKLLNQFRIEE